MTGKDVTAADRILVADGNQEVLENVIEALTESGYQAESAGDCGGLLERAATDGWSVLMIDSDLPGMDNIELLIRLQEFCPETSVVILASCPTLNGAVQAMRHGACDLLTKPFDLQDLIGAVQRGVRRHHRYLRSAAGNERRVPV